MTLSLKIKRLDSELPVPSYAYAGDAAFDLRAREEVALAPGARVQVQTGLALAIPEGYVGLIWDKSGISHAGGIKTLGGVIDSGYRGEIMVGVINLSDEPHVFKRGEKVAQMLIQKIEQVEFEEVDEFAPTERGARGFGSSK